MKLIVNDSIIIWPGKIKNKPEGFLIPTHLKVLTVEEKPFVYVRKATGMKCEVEEVLCPNYKSKKDMLNLRVDREEVRKKSIENTREVKEQKRRMFKALKKWLETKEDRDKTELKKERAILRKIRGEKRRQEMEKGWERIEKCKNIQEFWEAVRRYRPVAAAPHTFASTLDTHVPASTHTQTQATVPRTALPGLTLILMRIRLSRRGGNKAFETRSKVLLQPPASRHLRPTLDCTRVFSWRSITAIATDARRRSRITGVIKQQQTPPLTLCPYRSDRLVGTGGGAHETSDGRRRRVERQLH
ncbi:hypothetical protein TSAR_013753 [Trichomalopsis sarcophagae]|uniref:Uncharacterized protein n=1 Tax=Trichomalopsis sarcophagae TaxID=543379 RepID=A0A232FMV7_9HYME|nr:hypothetical protein TSAR_013753 [Trichomalopsis sarcophagae]